MNNKASIKIFGGWALLLIWGAFMVLNAKYRHLHYDSYGNLVSHSHYTSDAQDDHDHSDEDFYWLDMLSNPNFEEAVNIRPFISCTAIQVSNEISTYTSFISTAHIGEVEARGPPQALPISIS